MIRKPTTYRENIIKADRFFKKYFDKHSSVVVSEKKYKKLPRQCVDHQAVIVCLFDSPSLSENIQLIQDEYYNRGKAALRMFDDYRYKNKAVAEHNFKSFEPTCPRMVIFLDTPLDPDTMGKEIEVLKSVLRFGRPFGMNIVFPIEIYKKSSWLRELNDPNIILHAKVG